MSSFPYRAGIGFDSHRLSPGRKLVLGGVRFPGDRGLTGHSDGDVLLHAITDSLLGAMGLPDIGTRFPDSDNRFADADSASLLADVAVEVRSLGYGIVNLDCVIVCDEPPIHPQADSIRNRIGAVLGIAPEAIGVKAKTTEGTLLAEPGKSIAAFATVLLTRS